jgi:hypothetical protein
METEEKFGCDEDKKKNVVHVVQVADDDNKKQVVQVTVTAIKKIGGKCEEESEDTKQLADWQRTYVRVCVLTRVFRGIKFLPRGDMRDCSDGRKILDRIFEVTSLDSDDDRWDYLPEIEQRVRFILSQRRSTVVKNIKGVVTRSKYRIDMGS